MRTVLLGAKRTSGCPIVSYHTYMGQKCEQGATKSAQARHRAIFAMKLADEWLCQRDAASMKKPAEAGLDLIFSWSMS